jgi:hypothetical protein
MNLDMDGSQQDCCCQGKIVALFFNCDENHARNEELISGKTFPYSRNLSASTNQQVTSQEGP